MLLLGQSDTYDINANFLYCKSCPYSRTIVNRMVKKLVFTAKAVDDVIGGSKSWENVDQMDARCPKCDHNRAYFYQLQIRSADEPMSIFHKVRPSIDLIILYQKN